MAETLIAGRYRLDEILGRGGMSEVWLATDVELDRRVALKLLAPNADVERFEREARAVAALAHPNVTQVYDYGEEGDRPYMVLEYVPDGTLEDRLTPGPLPDAETRAIATDIAAGLAHAHARGVVHRDLKPTNVLFDEEGRAKLADFGIAQAAGDGTLTDAGTILGTAAYIPPEQASGHTATPASDVYSFGVILFRMLTGVPPFTAEAALELIRLHRDEKAPAVTSVRADAPPELAALAGAALAKDPRARPQDGAALLEALDGAEILPPEPTEATQVLGAPPPPPRQRGVHPALVFALLALLAIAGAVFAYAITRPDNTASSPPTTTSPTKPFTLQTTSTKATTTSPSTSTTVPTTAPTTVPVTTVHTTVHTTTAPPPPPTTTAPPPTTTATPTTTAPTTTGP